MVFGSGTQQLTRKLKEIYQAAYFTDQFLLFGCLPGDLRQQIWDIVLDDETGGRLVVFDDWDGTIVPTMNLVPSPLFSTNRESRARAQAFYETKINVYKRYSKDHWASLVAQGDYAAFSTLEESWNEEDDVFRAGILHLNLERDMFACGFDSLYDYNIGTRVRRLHNRLSALLRASKYFKTPLPFPDIAFPHGPYYPALRCTTSCLPKGQMMRCLCAVHFQSSGNVTKVSTKLLPYAEKLLCACGIRRL